MQGATRIFEEKRGSDQLHLSKVVPAQKLAHDDQGRVPPLVQAEMRVMEKWPGGRRWLKMAGFGAGTSVAGLHVDALEEGVPRVSLPVRRDELGQLLHVLRLPDLDSADGSEADHDVVCRGPVVMAGRGGAPWRMMRQGRWLTVSTTKQVSDDFRMVWQ
eukprot:Skav231246  [mRNA]  locus=scaffold411:162242:167008:+ [translate_table: standard]